MTIKERFSEITIDKIQNEYEGIRTEIGRLSNSDKKYLSLMIEKERYRSYENVLKAILVYSLFEPDEAISVAQTKGVFRYRLYGFSENVVLKMLNTIDEFKDILKFSNTTREFIKTKIDCSCIYDFYKNNEDRLRKLIRKHHENRKIFEFADYQMESSLFKELLVYYDFYFYVSGDKYEALSMEEKLNKNLIQSYSKEEIGEAISYLIYLYDAEIGIKAGINYNIDSSYVIGNEIVKMVLIAAKIKQIESWELCIDYFGYKIEHNGRKFKIYDPTEEFEKSVRMGYIRTIFQNLVMAENFRNDQKFKDVLSLNAIAMEISQEEMFSIKKIVGEGAIKRYRFEMPSILFEILRNNQTEKGKWFLEEILDISYISNDLIMHHSEIYKKQITEHCTLLDVLLFKRYFVFIELITKTMLITNNNKLQSDKGEINTVLSSMVPIMSRKDLRQLINFIVNDELKTNELIDIFTYKKEKILDLQYTPLLEVGEMVFIPTTIISNSNLMRNIIARSYLTQNQYVNQDQGLEPLVTTCRDIFEKCSFNYKVFINKKYKYHGKSGEIDVMVIGDEDIILIECKSPLLPSNNFELRSTVNHIEKANAQLTKAKIAFEDKAFVNQYLKSSKIPIRDYKIHTCIVMGNRLFSGYKNSVHPVRYIYELDMVLNKGIIKSAVGDWSVWESSIYQHSDLLKYLSNHETFLNIGYDALMECEYTLKGNDGKIFAFGSYYHDTVKTYKSFDENLEIISEYGVSKEQLYKLYNKKDKEFD